MKLRKADYFRIDHGWYLHILGTNIINHISNKGIIKSSATLSKQGILYSSDKQ